MNKQTYSTVIIVDQDQTRSIEVNTKVLQYLKPTVVGLAAATLVFGVSLIALAVSSIVASKENSALRDKVTELEGYTSAEVGIKINELKKSEKALLELQNYLQERGAFTPTPVKEGLETGKNNAAGGPAIKVSNGSSLNTQFAQMAQALLEATKKVPLGAPVGTEISSRFGVRENPFTGGGGERHQGLDFRGEIGEPIKSTATGTVNFAGYQNGYGNIVRITLESGYEIMFAHMSEIKVQEGQKVTAGDIVGTLGSTGRSTGPHLHYEIRKDGVAIDPERFLTLLQK